MKKAFIFSFMLSALICPASAQECVRLDYSNLEDFVIRANSEFVVLDLVGYDFFELHSTTSLLPIGQIQRVALPEADFTLTENELVTISASGSEIIFIDLESSAVVRQVSLPSGASGCGHAFASSDEWVAVSCLPPDRAPGAAAQVFVLFEGSIEAVPSPSHGANQHIFGFSLNAHENTLLIGSIPDFRLWEGGPMPEGGVWTYDLSNRELVFFAGEAGPISASGAYVAAGDGFVATSTSAPIGPVRTTVLGASGFRGVVDVGGNLSASGEFLLISQTASADGERPASTHLYRVHTSSLENEFTLDHATHAFLNGRVVFYLFNQHGEDKICRIEL